MACNYPIYGGIRLRPTPSADTRCSAENVEVPIEPMPEIPAGIVKRLKEEREASSGNAKENKSKVANLFKPQPRANRPSKAYPIKSPEAVHANKSPSKSPLINSPSKSILQSSTTGWTTLPSGADKYGTTARSYDSGSFSVNPRGEEISRAGRNYVNGSSPRSEEILRASRNYVANVRNGSKNDKYGMGYGELTSDSASTVFAGPRNQTVNPSEKNRIHPSVSMASTASKRTEKTWGLVHPSTSDVWNGVSMSSTTSMLMGTHKDHYGYNASSVATSTSECAPSPKASVPKSHASTVSFGSTFCGGSVKERYGAASFEGDSTKSPAVKDSWTRMSNVEPSEGPNQSRPDTPRNHKIIQEAKNHVGRQDASPTRELKTQPRILRNQEIIAESRSHVSLYYGLDGPNGDNQWKSQPTLPSNTEIKSNVSFGEHTTGSAVAAKSSESSAISAKSSESYFTLPPLCSYGNDVIDASDEVILETELCKRFIDAFEDTLVDRPLPGSLSVIEGIKRRLRKIRSEKGKMEDEMLKRIVVMDDVKKEIEGKLVQEKEALDDMRNELCTELTNEQQAKERAEAELQKQLEEIQALKSEVQSKNDDVTKEKEELTRHLNTLATSRKEILSSIETESALVEKDKNALLGLSDCRRSIQTASLENKELERKVELMMEAASKRKAALQAESADLKDFEASVQKLKEANEATVRELDEEKKDLLDMTLRYQKKKQEVLENKRKIENDMKAEREDCERQMEKSRMMPRGMKRMVNRRSLGHGGKGMNIEALIKSRVDAELKKRGIDAKERELEMNDGAMKERGMRHGRLEGRRRSLEKMTTNDRREQTATKELHDEKAEAWDDVFVLGSGSNIEMVVKSRVEAELKQKETELKARDSERSISGWNSSVSTRERHNNTANEDLPLPDVYVSPRNDDETTLGDDSTIILNELSKDQIKQMMLENKGKSSKLIEMEKELQSLREARLQKHAYGSCMIPHLTQSRGR